MFESGLPATRWDMAIPTAMIASLSNRNQRISQSVARAPTLPSPRQREKRSQNSTRRLLRTEQSTRALRAYVLSTARHISRGSCEIQMGIAWKRSVTSDDTPLVVVGGTRSPAAQ